MQIEIKVPDNLSEITVEQYQRFIKLVKDNEQSDFVSQKSIEIFCGIKLIDVAKISFNSINEVLTHINSLFEKKQELVKKFKINDVEFGFIPNLEGISFGEFTDLDNYIGKPEYYHKAMAVLYRPIESKFKTMYNIEEYSGTEKYSEVMKYAPLDALLGALVFFSTLEKELLLHSLDYLDHLTTEQQEILALSHNLPISGDGTIPFTQSVKEILQSSMQ
jgi:hypothetical protein